MLGNCVKQQVQMIREFNPKATIILWSDMFDPNHNAKPKGHYYLADDDFHGSWNHMPKDNILIAVWNLRNLGPTLAHFDSLGFKSIVAGYYDKSNLDKDKKILDELDKSKGVVGYMYTTWLAKYKLLEEFGQLLNKRWGKVKK
jgi:hypothetical protein